MAAVDLIFADDDDLIAIYEYVERQRPHIPQFRTLQGLIESFETWYQGLGYWDLHVMINDTLGEAVRRRNEINRVMGAIFDPTLVPGDLSSHLAPGSTLLAGRKPPFIPAEYKVAATVSAVAVAVLVILKKLYII